MSRPRGPERQPCLLRVLLPCDGDLLGLLREMSRELATGAGLDAKAAEYLCVAVVEAASRRIELQGSGRLMLSFRVTGGELCFDLGGQAQGEGGEPTGVEPVHIDHHRRKQTPKPLGRFRRGQAAR